MSIRPDFRWFAKRAYLELMRAIPDSAAIGLDYFRVFGTFPNLTAPRTFSEKVQHMKLHLRNAEMATLVDKVLVKEVVRKKLGDSWIIPTLWHGERLTENVLRGMSKPVVIKANHSSAQVFFLTPDCELREAVRTANGWSRFDYHLLHREWAYRGVPRKILIEPFIGGAAAPDDYKFWVFDGVVRFVQVDQGRFDSHTRAFYTPEWDRLDFKLKYPNALGDIPAPQHLRDMVEAAQLLAKGLRFARVDLYDTPEKPLFGEITFAPEAGLCQFDPPQLDLELGDSWSYPRPPRVHVQ